MTKPRGSRAAHRAYRSLRLGVAALASTLLSCDAGEGRLQVALVADLPAAWLLSSIHLDLTEVALQTPAHALTDEGFVPLPLVRGAAELVRGASPVLVASGELPARAYGAVWVRGRTRPLLGVGGQAIEPILEPIALPLVLVAGGERTVVVELVLLEAPASPGHLLLFVKHAVVGSTVPIS